MHSAIHILFALLSISNQANAFTTTLHTKSLITPSFSTSCPTVPLNNHQPRSTRRFHLFSSTDGTELEEEIKSMRVGAIKQELESYGISTRTFLEKSELVDALITARKEGKEPISTQTTTSTTSSSSSSNTSSATETSSSTSTTTTATPTNPEERQQRIKEEQEKCKGMKVGELKSELESLGVSTKSFFEKSEFVRALAEARVDGVKKSKKKKRRTVSDDDEVEEVTAKVEVITNDDGPKTKKSRDNASAGDNPFGGGGSPFGGMPFGGGGAPGGMGGMDMGDILKNMGGMGGAGAGAAGGNPFAGAAGGANPFGGGANPFGGGAGMADAMKAAQQAMSNPKVQKVIQKAQKNPKVMQAVQECMSNPMAMSKYMSDPEVGPILKELQEAMM